MTLNLSLLQKLENKWDLNKISLFDKFMEKKQRLKLKFFKHIFESYLVGIIFNTDSGFLFRCINKRNLTQRYSKSKTVCPKCFNCLIV